MSSAKLFGSAICVEAEEERGGGGSPIAVEVPRSVIQTDCNPFLDSNSDPGSVSMDDAEPGFIDFFHREPYDVDTVRDFCIASNHRVINSASSGGAGPDFNIWEEGEEGIELGLGIGSRSGSGDSLVHREIDSGIVEAVGTGLAPTVEYSNLSQEAMVVGEEFEWQNLHNSVEWVQQVIPSRDDDDDDDDDDLRELWNANMFVEDTMDFDQISITIEDGDYDAAVLAQMFDNQDGVIMGRPPASKTVVDDLPALVITSEQLSNGNTIICAICKDDILAEEKAKSLPCKHFFHGECIVPWLGIRNTCPVCRFELPTDDLQYETNRRGSQRRASNGFSQGR